MAEPQRTRSESSSPGAPVELDDDHGLPGGAAQDQEEQLELRRGPWTVDEDLTLVNYIACHGEGRWNSLARATGLKRTGKSCRLRWLNYLRPDVRRGNITADEQLLILDLHTRWGNRWSKIAQHLPGRTDNEIKNYFRTRVRKHAKQLNCDANSKRFKDTMRYLLMPHLVDAAARRCRLQAQHHQHAAAAHGLSAIGMVTSSSDSFATTAESYRPGKLDSLLRHGCALPKGVADEISLIKLDLEKIIAISSNLQEDDHAMMVRCWRKEVRELSYDMDDFADQYEHAAAMTCARSIRGREITRQLKSKRSLPWIREKLRQRLWMANKIREFSERTQEALERHRLYNLDAIAGSASFSCTDDAYPTSWNGTPYGEDKAYVGIDAAMEKLEELLMMTHDQGHQKLQVVSIVGFGGVGKTTLAMELYRKLGHQFECRAFVRTSQKPDMRRIFISMLSQVRPHQPPDNWTVHGLISTIRTHLQDKRYLIIVENLWTTSTWDIVKHALPDSNCCSRILTTTEIEDLALQSCDHDPKYVYKMQPLGEDNSRKLFFSSVFGPQDECPPELREISHDIIRKCGGLPLAIVTVASILSSQPGKQDRWDYVNKAIGYSLLTNPTWEGMKQIFDLSYNNLPQHLKACILYTGLYEEDIVIWKDDLVNQWLAEGFIQAKEGQDKKEIASSFFDRLINGKLILPVDVNKKGEVLSCTIHHMVLNLVIRCKSIEENFVTAIHHSQATTTLADKVRRLSLQFGNAEDAITPPNMRLSHVRTLAFWGVFQCLPSVVQFRLLQVLILHFWGDKDSISFDITTISELFRLRYLKVTSNVTLELRTQMRGLNSLETLTIDARVSSVPSDIVHLPGLLHLSLPAETNLPNGIGHMTSLRTLGCFDICSNSIENVQSLSMLTNLEDLQLTCSTVQTENLNSKMQFMLNSILGRLSNLKSLTLASRAPSYAKSIGATGMTISGGFSRLSSAPALLRSLKVSPQICIFFYIPKWIGQLRELCVLKFGVRRIDRDGVDVLRGLPALSVLTLYVQTKPAARIVIGKTGFQVIKCFRFKCCDALLEFEEGAMPNLRKLKLAFNASNADQQSTIPVGIEYLSELKEVSAKIGGVGPEESHRRAAELAFRDAIRVHARFQRVNVRCVKQIIECKDDQSSVTTVENSDDKSSVTTVKYSPAPVPVDSLAALLRPAPVEEVWPEEDRRDTLTEVIEALAQAGLESSNLIIGIDFTKSNEWTGKNSFNGMSLHHIGDTPNPYEQAISIIGQTLSAFDEDNLIPCYGFGDASTHDQDVFAFYPDERPCNGFQEALARYREIVPRLRLAGPRSFAPIIEMATTIVERSGGQYHVLVIIANGQVTRSVDTKFGQLSTQEQMTVDAIVQASEFPLSIILVGVGDGPWDMMKEFDDNIPARSFDNFQFVNFTAIMSKKISQSKKETEFALSALMEIPLQYKATLELGILGRRLVKSPERVPLPPPFASYSTVSRAAPSRANSYRSVPSRPREEPTVDSTITASVTSPPAVETRVSEPLMCPVCLSKPRDMAFGCGHQTCSECGPQVADCPICRRPIDTRVKLY